MEYAIGAVLGLVLITWIINSVNRRFDEQRENHGPSPDARVTEAWDDFGLTDDGDASRAALDQLLAAAPIEALESKESLVRIALMALRADDHAVFPAIAKRVRVVAEGCGETLAIEALAEAYEGDATAALPLLERARAGLAGCASCAGDVEGKILLQEVAIAQEALADGNLDSADERGDDGSADGSAAGWVATAARERATASQPRDGDGELARPDVSLERADAWVDREGTVADAWVAKGAALVRMGSIDSATRAFERARSLDRDCWPAALGLAVTAHEKHHRGISHADALAARQTRNPHDDALRADLVDGWSALSAREQTVMAHATSQLGELLEALVDAGARVRVVPIHLRARDADVTAGALGERVFCNGETFDAQGVFVSARRCVLRWDALADASERSPWWAARAIGLMASQVLPDATRKKLAAALPDANEVEVAVHFANAYAERVRILANAGEERGAENAAGDKVDDARRAVSEVLAGMTAG